MSTRIGEDWGMGRPEIEEDWGLDVLTWGLEGRRLGKMVGEEEEGHSLEFL